MTGKRLIAAVGGFFGIRPLWADHAKAMVRRRLHDGTYMDAIEAFCPELLESAHFGLDVFSSDVRVSPETSAMSAGSAGRLS